MQSAPRLLVVLGTGGTIAGSAASADDNVGYRRGDAAGRGARRRRSPAPAGVAVESEQVAQLDSKDMDFATWRALAGRVAGHLARPEVAAIVVTHGTDTLEETAYFLQRVLAPAKPVVLHGGDAAGDLAPAPTARRTCADAVAVARDARRARRRRRSSPARVHSALDVRKVHPYRLDAFGSGDAGPIARVEEGRLRRFAPWPDGDARSGSARSPAERRVGVAVGRRSSRAAPAPTRARFVRCVDAGRAPASSSPRPATAASTLRSRRRCARRWRAAAPCCAARAASTAP